MVTRLFFNEIIKDALDNLYDYASLETHPAIFSVIKLPHGFSGNKGEFVRQVVVDGIEKLRPPHKELSLTSPEWRPYIILQKRYIEGLPLQELAGLLAISPRQMRRDHHKAISALNEILWSFCFPDQSSDNESDFDQMIEVHNEMIDPVETIRGVYKMLRHQFELKNIEVVFRDAEVFIPLVTDRVILRQILISLFNDLLHNHQTRRVDVRCATSADQIMLEFTCLLNDEKSSLNYSHKSSTDELTAVAFWCERIRARVEESFLKEGGKCFVKRTIWLPHSEQKIMLVIDDQEAVVNLFKRYLSQIDILIIGVSHPEQAISLARHLHPALITLDVMMPQVDGWELLQLIKLDESLKEIPVIVCSAWDDPDLSHSLGAQIYLKKPVTQKMLLDAVNSLIIRSDCDN